MSRTLAAVFRLTDQYTSTMRRIIQSQESFERQQAKADAAAEKFRQRLSQIGPDAGDASSGIGAFTKQIGGLVSAAYIGKKAVDTLVGAIKTGATIQVQKNTFGALTGAKEAGNALYDYVSSYAKLSALSREQLASATSAFIPYTKDINQIEQLIKLTERLYMKNPAQGAEGAVFAIKELLAGDTMSIKGRFNMTGFSGKKIREMANSGNVQGMIDYFDTMFARFGASQEVVDANFQSLTTQVNLFKSNIVSAMGDEANPAVQSLSATFQRLNEDMNAGRFQPFFTLVANGTQAIASGVGWLADNLNVVAPVVVGVATALLAYHAATSVATMVTTIAGVVVSATTQNWLGLAAAIAGAAAAYGIYKGMENSGVSVTDAQRQLEEAKKLAGTELGKTPGVSLPVDITNKSPISVKGTVEIERESLKYLFEVSKMKFFASFNTSTMSPQFNMYGDVNQTADVDELFDQFGTVIHETAAVQAAGAYK